MIYGKVLEILLRARNKAIVRTAIALVEKENAVVAMDDQTVGAISKEAIPEVR